MFIKNVLENQYRKMASANNLLAKLCAFIFVENPNADSSEWRLLGQEQNGTLLFSWIENVCTKIGIYTPSGNNFEFEIIYKFETIQNVIQASVNSSKTLLGYVVKYVPNDAERENWSYNAFIADLKSDYVYNFKINNDQQKQRQVMIQFLYKKHSLLNDTSGIEKVLVFVHQECILVYQINLNNMSSTPTESVDNINDKCFSYETLVGAFIWAQWDCMHQVLYYIHFRKQTKCLVEGEENEIPEKKISPTLSGLQFHDDLPHETVLNIPMNLPHMGIIQNNTGQVIYEDDPVPLRIHDSTLDLQVISNSNGLVCICHHYLYQSVNVSTSDFFEPVDNSQATVNFAYSVTLLHHSCVLQCVVPGIPWIRAKQICPTFMLYEDHHILVLIPGLFTHLLDIGINHEPCGHIVMPCLINSDIDLRLVPLCYDNNTVINLNTLDIIKISIPNSLLIETFKSETALDNKIAIIHYLLVHKNQFEIVSEALSYFIEKPLNLGLPQMLKEFLIGSAYVTVQKNFPSDATQLINLLSVTTLLPRDTEIRINKYCVQLSQDILWNTAMMLLSPQQRIVPYRMDLWTKLWENLMQTGKTKAKFKPSQVAEKLMVSLMCYQPEALSRSSTPLSPGGVLGNPTDLSVISGQGGRKNQMDSLPFYEFESCTASKQEHIISVNLREISMHLLKHSFGNNTFFNRQQWQSQSPIHVHAVATRYVAAQLEQSKYLCQLMCRSVNIQSKHEQEKGFILIDNLPDDKRNLLFTLLERYYLTIESIAFPLPQGFTSFFTFLGYRTLKFESFLQYVQRNVFELQVDVMKVIMMDTVDSKQGLLQKLKLLSLLPRSRAKRLLNAWGHPVSIMLRAREHALNILSGVEGSQSRSRGLQRPRTNQFGLAAFPSADRLSPLDTFLDLLTAKASLAELDFGLLVEATITSTEEFFF